MRISNNYDIENNLRYFLLDQGFYEVINSPFVSSISGKSIINHILCNKSAFFEISKEYLFPNFTVFGNFCFIVSIAKLEYLRYNILNNVIALEEGLKKLGYDDDIILVAHSLGGFYSTLFASRNEQNVKQVVFIDASLASNIPSYLESLQSERRTLNPHIINLLIANS